MISDGTPDGEIVDALTSRDAIDLKALDDIFSGNNKGIEYYYGEGSHDPSKDASYWAETLAKNHLDAAQKYLNIRRTEFKSSELGTNAVTDHLDEELDMSRRIVERVNDDYHKILVLVFHALYDPETGSLGKEFEKMAAKTKIFKDNKEQVYHLDEPFDIDDVTSSVTEHVREQNADAVLPAGYRFRPSVRRQEPGSTE